MLLPFCYFAFKKSFLGMCLSIFALATSMMWFPEPAYASADAGAFLQMELEYLTSEWSLPKILMAGSVPLVFIFLGIAFWSRKYFWGFMVLVFSMAMKMLWSLIQGGDSAYVLFPAAIGGILISGILIFLAKKKYWI